VGTWSGLGARSGPDLAPGYGPRSAITRPTGYRALHERAVHERLSGGADLLDLALGEQLKRRAPPPWRSPGPGTIGASDEARDDVCQTG
jgi:hypothetical protein